MVDFVSGNGLSHGQHQAIAWNNADLLSIEPSGANSNESQRKTGTFSFRKMHFKMSYTTWQTFCSGLIC